MIDFFLAKAQHSLWKIKLISFLHGELDIKLTDFVSHRDCRLGKWLYSTGMAEYGSIPEMQSLETLHQQLHAIASIILEMKHLVVSESAHPVGRFRKRKSPETKVSGNERLWTRGEVDAAELELAQIEPLSEKIVDSIDSVEQKVKQKLPRSNG